MTCKKRAPSPLLFWAPKTWPGFNTLSQIRLWSPQLYYQASYIWVCIVIMVVCRCDGQPGRVWRGERLKEQRQTTRTTASLHTCIITLSTPLLAFHLRQFYICNTLLSPRLLTQPIFYVSTAPLNQRNWLIIKLPAIYHLRVYLMKISSDFTVSLRAFINRYWNAHYSSAHKDLNTFYINLKTWAWGKGTNFSYGLQDIND